MLGQLNVLQLQQMDFTFSRLEFRLHLELIHFPFLPKRETMDSLLLSHMIQAEVTHLFILI